MGNQNEQTETVVSSNKMVSHVRWKDRQDPKSLTLGWVDKLQCGCKGAGNEKIAKRTIEF